MTRSHRLVSLAAAVVAATTALGVAAPASGRAAPPDPDPIVTGLGGPLQIDIGHHGQIFVAEAFNARLSRIDAGAIVVFHGEQVSVSGIAARRKTVAFTIRGDDPANPLAQLKVWRMDGSTRVVADLAAYEATRNPDRHNRYGFRGLSADCLSQVPPDFRPYQGQVDSNPYALLNTRGGWYVADAGANAILKVSGRGHVSTVAVLRPQVTTISAEVAESFGLPDCVAGKKFAFEPVPTDVERDPHGGLLATLLPGGPEDASLGARGAVVHVAWGGGSHTVAGGLLGATNLAVGPRGGIYVAELFGNKITAVRNGRTRTVADVPSPAALEWWRGRLIATTDVFGAGNLVSIRP